MFLLVLAALTQAKWIRGGDSAGFLATKVNECVRWPFTDTGSERLWMKNVIVTKQDDVWMLRRFNEDDTSCKTELERVIYQGEMRLDRMFVVDELPKVLSTTTDFYINQTCARLKNQVPTAYINEGCRRTGEYSSELLTLTYDDDDIPQTVTTTTFYGTQCQRVKDQVVHVCGKCDGNMTEYGYTYYQCGTASLFVLLIAAVLLFL